MPMELEKQNQGIYEKIQELIEWNREYPLVQVSNIFYREKYLERYCHSKEEYRELLKKFIKMQEMYAYVRTRRSQGKLTPEQEEMCREGNIRGPFGYPKVTQDLSREYGLAPKKIDYIISKYGSMKKFIQAFRKGKIDKEDEELLSDNLNTFIDINKSKNVNIIKFVRCLLETIKGATISENENYQISIFDSSKIEELINKLEPKRAQILCLSFGLHDDKAYTQREIGKKFGISQQAICASINESLMLLARSEMYNPIVFQGGENCQKGISKKIAREQMKEIASAADKIYSSKLIFIPDEGMAQEADDIIPSELVVIAAQIKAIREGKSDRQKQVSGKTFTPIETLELSARSYNALLLANIKTVEQLKDMTLEELSRVRRIGKKSLEEIQQKRETELQRVKRLKEEAATEAETERANAQEAISLHEAYDKLYNAMEQNKKIGEGR